MTPDLWLLRCFDREQARDRSFSETGWGRLMFEVLNDHPASECSKDCWLGCHTASWPVPALGDDISYGAGVGEAIAS